MWARAMVGGDGVATLEDLSWCPHPSTRGGAAASYSGGLGLRYQPTSLKRGEGLLVAEMRVVDGIGCCRGMCGRRGREDER
jgi:hypothetical protein